VIKLATQQLSATCCRLATEQLSATCLASHRAYISSLPIYGDADDNHIFMQTAELQQAAESARSGISWLLNFLPSLLMINSLHMLTPAHTTNTIMLSTRPWHQRHLPRGPHERKQEGALL
jgi:hypothetical protein